MRMTFVYALSQTSVAKARQIRLIGRKSACAVATIPT